MNKVLVTGTAGFIGFHLTKQLVDDGYNLWLFNGARIHFRFVEISRFAPTSDISFHRKCLIWCGKVTREVLNYKIKNYLPKWRFEINKYSVTGRNQKFRSLYAAIPPLSSLIRRENIDRNQINLHI